MNEFMKTFWMNNSELIQTYAMKAIVVVLVLVIGYFAVKIIHRWIQKANMNKERIDATVIPVFKSIISLSVFSVCMIIILDQFGINTNSILAIFGAAGIAVALALKDTLSNIAAGIMLLFLKPFKTGHFIETGSTMGTVREIGLFTTILETADGLYISSPNSIIWNGTIKNFTKNGKRRMDLTIGISYNDSIDTGIKVLKEVAEKDERFFKDPAPYVFVQTMADSSVNLQLRAWTDVDNYWDAYWDNQKKIKESIEAAGLTIPFPQRVIHNVSG